MNAPFYVIKGKKKKKVFKVILSLVENSYLRNFAENENMKLHGRRKLRFKLLMYLIMLLYIENSKNGFFSFKVNLSGLDSKISLGKIRICPLLGA